LGAVTEVEIGQIERKAWATPDTLGLSLAEAKQLSAAIQKEMVRAQASIMGERFRCCGRCGTDLSSKGYRQVTFRSLFGKVPLRVRRFQTCPCLEVPPGAPRSFSALALEGCIAPELAHVTAKFAALAPFGKVAAFLAELLPVGGAVNAGTVRNRTPRVGERIARLRPAGTSEPDIDAVTPAVVIGLDGGYLRSRHRRPERNFEVIAGKVLHLNGSQRANSLTRSWATASVSAPRRRCSRTATRGCGNCTDRSSLRKPSSSTGGTSPCASSTPCRRHEGSVQTRRAPTFVPTPFAISIVPSGSSGTAARVPVSGAWLKWRLGSPAGTFATSEAQSLLDGTSMI
jgi:hypothetical protein